MKKILTTLFCLCIAPMVLADCPKNIEITVNEAGIGSVGKAAWFSTSFIAKNSKIGNLVFVVGIKDIQKPTKVSSLICQYKIGDDSKTEDRPVTPLTSKDIAESYYILAHVDQDAQATIDTPSNWKDFKVDTVTSKFCVPAGNDTTCAFKLLH